MPYDIFSERTKQEADPYRYDEIPERLRNQICHVLQNVMQDTALYGIGDWEKLWNDCCQEKGLPPCYGNNYVCREQFREYLTQKENGVEDILDMIDITFQFIENSPSQQQGGRAIEPYDKAADDLNAYFQRASVGYQLIENQIMRTDSEYHHRETVVPALILLRSSEFESANEEFLSAHEHYRNGEYRDCITNANAAFESVMKVICDQKEWEYNKGTAGELVAVLLRKEFIPNYLQGHFQQLLATLGSGLPPLRHKQGSAHGKGEKTTEVPAHMAGYALHLAATNILFLVQTSESED